MISGFEAFGGEDINPTHLLIDEVRAGRVELPSEAVIDTILLPVGFENAFDLLLARIQTFSPDVVLALGQAGGRAAIELERVAINLIDAEAPDNNGVQPRDVPVEAGGLSAFFSTLPLRRLLAALGSNGIPCCISNSAGLYVCNFLFYRLQSHFSSSGAAKVRSGFIHFPYLPEQVRNRPAGAKSMPLETMNRALAMIIATISE